MPTQQGSGFARRFRWLVLGFLLLWLGLRGTPSYARPAGEPLHDIIALEAGDEHSCALTGSGGVKCWGHNGLGQLGDGTTTVRLIPVDVTGLSSGVIDVAAGAYHTCAVTAGGGVKCWGHNGSGQLGDGTTIDRHTPVDVTGLSSGVIDVEAGAYHTCAVTAGGGVKCWGDNFYGPLGDGTMLARYTPTDVIGLSSGVTALAAGARVTCALMMDGGVKCWGLNEDGQLGDGTTTVRLIPVDVTGLSSGVIDVAAGAYHTCAVTAGGGVKCWGHNGSGQLGDGTTIDRHTPVDVIGLSSGVRALAAGYAHTCAVTVGGEAKCWGANEDGRLGDGTTIKRLTPTKVSGLGSEASTVAAGRWHTCALMVNGGIKCWGDNREGQLGDGTRPERYVPAEVSGLSSGVSALAAGYEHTCALTVDGGVKCWGRNFFGQLGLGPEVGFYQLTPADVSGLSSGASSVAAGGKHTCAVTVGGGLKCWGHNGLGQLGDGTGATRSTPTDVKGLSSGVTALPVGGTLLDEDYSCALTVGGRPKCWGINGFGELGDGTGRARNVPVEVGGFNGGVISLVKGGHHACALTDWGALKCWGLNGSGQVGTGTNIEDHYVPADVIGLESGGIAIAAGGYHTCALTEGGGVKCWGYNAYGQLGDGTTTERDSPTDVRGLSSGVVGLAMGEFHTCALLVDGGVKCWGHNKFGRLGDGTFSDRLTPTDVTGLSSGVKALEAGGYHTCALLVDGGVKCWGGNIFGQLGNGVGRYSPVPVDVIAPWQLHLPLVVKK